MEPKKTIFDYLEQVFCIFGITMAILMVFCKIVGESAKGADSTMFALGGQGLALPVMLEFLALSIFIVAMRCLFFTDAWIKKMPLLLRTGCMIISIIGMIAIFSIVFGWFPVHQWLPWCLFFVCFGICFLISTLLTMLKERAENRKMEEGLQRLKKELEGKDGEV